MSESVVGTFNTDTPAPSAAARKRLEVERTELQQRLQALVVRGDEMTGPGDAVDHAQSLSRQVEQEHVQGQLNQLEMMLSLPPREDEDVPAGTIAVGSTVRLGFAGGDEETMLLATIEEADEQTSVLTFDSPLGTALVGRKLGDEVEYQAPAGRIKVRVLAVDTPRSE